ncbi:MAG: hypothetical protein ACLGH1_03160 [Gammaproteobacteria bacterium]
MAAHDFAVPDPAIPGTNLVPASKLCLQKTGWTVDDLDLMGINAAFAAQYCAVCRALCRDTGTIDVNGGAISIGHPIEASGCRVLVKLIQ